MSNSFQKLIYKPFSSLIFLIFLYSNAYINSKELNFPVIQQKHLNKVYDNCNKINYLFCSMIEAIKYAIYTSKLDSKSYPVNCTNIFCIYYQNVYSPNIICEDVESKIEKNEQVNSSFPIEKYLISFLNCSIIFNGALSLKRNKAETIINYDNFLSEINLDKINFFQNTRSTKGELDVSFEYNETLDDTFNYDKEDPIFTMTIIDLKEQMNNILKGALNNYRNSLESKIEIDGGQQITQIKYLNEIINKFAKNYSLFNFKIDENENNITYIAYNNIHYNSFVNIRNNIFIPYLYVSFEFALNYYIDYREGRLIFENVSISKNNEIEDCFGNLISKIADFSNANSTEQKLIWKVIENDFYDKFELYK